MLKREVQLWAELCFSTRMKCSLLFFVLGILKLCFAATPLVEEAHVEVVLLRDSICSPSFNFKRITNTVKHKSDSVISAGHEIGKVGYQGSFNFGVSEFI